MDRTMSSLLIFAAGCLTGASITFAAMKKRFEERMEKEREAEREFYEQQKIDIYGGDKALEVATKDAIQAFSKLGETLTVYGVPKENKESVPENFEEEVHAGLEFLKQTADEIEDRMLSYADDDGEVRIYPITADEYGANGFDQQQLYFYTADEVLADADDNIVEPDESNVGDDGIDIFVYTDAESCYIRNTETATDYEIMRVDGTFDSCESGGSYG